MDTLQIGRQSGLPEIVQQVQWLCTVMLLPIAINVDSQNNLGHAHLQQLQNAVSRSELLKSEESHCLGMSF